jgi:hypothetical protein
MFESEGVRSLQENSEGQALIILRSQSLIIDI